MGNSICLLNLRNMVCKSQDFYHWFDTILKIITSLSGKGSVKCEPARLRIYIYFLAFLPSFLPSVTPSPAEANGPRGEVFLSMYITYISVSKSTPLAVTGPHGQLASCILSVILCVSCPASQVNRG